MSFTDDLEQDILDHIFNRAQYTSLGNYYIALSSTTPTEAGGTFTEEVANGYTRQSTTSANWNNATAADPSLIDNSDAITFSQATGDWEGGSNLTHFGIFTAITAGTLIMFGALDTAKPVLSGDTAEFAIGDLNITLD